MSIKIPFSYGCQIFVLSLVMTYFILPRMCLYANKIGLLDYSNERKVHKVGKPLVGGVAIALALSVSCFLFVETKQLLDFFVGMFLFLLIGFFDDYKNLVPRWKLLAQIFTAIIVVCTGEKVLLSFGNILYFGDLNPGIFAVPVTVFGIVGVINATNMIDGLDGLVGAVSTIALISLGTLAYINGQTTYMSLCIMLTGCVIAFLRYNWHPSLLFLGDAGSFLLGFSVVFLSIAITQKQNGIVPPVVPLLILAVPIVDIVSVSLRRIATGKNPFAADRAHIHHLFLRLGFKKREVVLILGLITTILSVVGIVGTIYKIPEYYLFSLFLAFFVAHFTFSLSIKKLIKFKSAGKKGWHNVLADTLPLSDVHKVVKINNERLHFRKTNCANISCTLETTNSNRSKLNKLLNISINGFAGRIDNYLSSSKHKIVLALPENYNNARLSVTAEIVWMYRDGGTYTYGFKFIKIGEEQRDILKCYL